MSYAARQLSGVIPLITAKVRKVMRKKKVWNQSADELLNQTVLEQAVEQAVEKTGSYLNGALSSLDTESLKLMELYFEGTPLTTIAAQYQLSDHEIKAWVNRCKAQLIKHIQSKVQVRQ